MFYIVFKTIVLFSHIDKIFAKKIFQSFSNVISLLIIVKLIQRISIISVCGN